jgi:hypothetical protein
MRNEINKRRYPKSQSNMEDIMKNRAIILLTGLVLALAVPATHAAIVTIAIEGVVDTIADPLNKLNSQVIPGSIVTGVYSYDTTVPDASALDTVGDYRQDGVNTQIEVSINGLVFYSVIGSPNYTIAVVNNKLGRDRYYVGSTTNYATYEFPISEISWNLEDHTEQYFSNTDLPLEPPSLSGWDVNLLFISEQACLGESFEIHGHITSAALVPEPITMIFMLTGGIFLRRRKIR